MVTMVNPRIGTKKYNKPITEAINRDGDWDNNPSAVRSVTTFQDVEVEGLVMDDEFGGDNVIISAECYTFNRTANKMSPSEIADNRIRELDVVIEDKTAFDVVFAQFSSLMDEKIKQERAERKRQK